MKLMFLNASTQLLILSLSTRTNKTIVKYQQKKTVTNKNQRYSAINKKDEEKGYHKHGFSWENIKTIQSTAWLTVVGDAVENIVHG